MQIKAVQVIEHTLRTVLRALQVIFLSAPIAGLAAGGLTEGVSAFLTHSFPGSILTHTLAIVFALVTGYAVALTYAVIESVRGAIRISEMLERDVFQQTSLLGRAAHGLEHTIGRL